MGHITFIYGGTRSGKSRYASSLAASLSPTVYYIATAQALDPEMSARIEKHRKDRPANFITVEEPQDLSRALKNIPDTADVVLVDCFTLLLSNWIFDENNSRPAEVLEENILHKIKDFLALTKDRHNPFVLVSNEVGQSLVATSSLGRLFCDLQGTT
ncbi:MAG: bifunctional adenosylcobinamide kinase/adenosylcobinamide-phosphate guanylyltransferase, partial [Candidatus Binatia bacterium]|nr:bifunctional adenosylcobinamide kinase/adenosylcobinamide-phosphate guanylyltransferase [Candidatus Binatia bacterium]